MNTMAILAILANLQFLQKTTPPGRVTGTRPAHVVLLFPAFLPPQDGSKNQHVFHIVLASLLGGSMTVLEPNMAPTWVDFGAMLAPFWTIFGCCFGLST